MGARREPLGALRVSHLCHQAEQFDHGCNHAIPAIFPVERIDIDGDAFGVAPALIVPECNIQRGIAHT